MHAITAKDGSDGECRDWHQNHCSCGWVGRKHFSHETFAHIDLLQEAVRHQQAESAALIARKQEKRNDLSN